MGWRQTIGIWKHRFRLFPGHLWRCELRLVGVTSASPPILCGRPIVSRFEGSTIEFGRTVCLDSSRRNNPLGGEKPCVLRTMNKQARILLGDRVGLSSATIVSGNSIQIGSDTLLGAGCMILDNDFHVPSGSFAWKTEYSSNSRPVSIGRGCFIGARAIILKGVTLGDRVVVGAGAVVTRSFPSGSVIGGNPAGLLQSRV